MREAGKKLEQLKAPTKAYGSLRVRFSWQVDLGERVKISFPIIEPMLEYHSCIV